MPKAADFARRRASAIGGAGTWGVVALSLGMNGAVSQHVKEPVAVIETLLTTAPPPAQRTTRKPPSSTPRRARRAPSAPGPLLATGLAGLDLGFGDADASLAQSTSALLTDLDGHVVDEADVDDAPVPTRREPPDFPARARSLGQSGFVTLSFVVDLDGTVQDVLVVESSPPGVFDESAAEAVRSWTFQPGRDDGAPAAVRVRQTLKFELE